jgi:hypothetical protein
MTCPYFFGSRAIEFYGIVPCVAHVSCNALGNEEGSCIRSSFSLIAIKLRIRKLFET